MSKSSSFSLQFFLRAALAGACYVIGAVLFGVIATAVHFQIPQFEPPGVNTVAAFRMFALTSILIGPALLPLAIFTKSSHLTRAFILFLLIFVCIGVNTVIELTIFSTFFIHGGALTVIVSNILPALLCGFALSYCLPAAADNSIHQAQPGSRSTLSWLLRIVAAILAFPVIYFVFGLVVAPYVVPFYRSGASPLIIPPLSSIIPVQILRSSLFLLASAPFLFLWTRSRAALILALGLAHWYLVGLFGLVQVTWLPPVLRIAHSLEIGADSFAYAAVLVLLLVRRHREPAVSTPAQVAPMFPS